MKKCYKHEDYAPHYILCPRCVDDDQRCHAVQCNKKIKPRRFMCERHWAMIPEAEQQRLGEVFDSEQYYTRTVTRAWNRQAMRCKLLVAECEGISVDLMQSYRYTVKG